MSTSTPLLDDRKERLEFILIVLLFYAGIAEKKSQLALRKKTFAKHAGNKKRDIKVTLSAKIAERRNIRIPLLCATLATQKEEGRIHQREDRSFVEYVERTNIMKQITCAKVVILKNTENAHPSSRAFLAEKGDRTTREVCARLVI
jgi:predicted transcriptional regulator